MSFTLNADYGSVNANSYVESVAEADSIATFLQYVPFFDFKSTVWFSASDPSKIVALQMAATSIDSQPFYGARAYQNQRREWPRIATGRSYWDHLDGTEAIPDDVKRAQVIEAAEMLSAAQKTSAQQGIVAESVGDHSVTYDKSVLQDVAKNIQPNTYEFLKRSQLIPTGAMSIYMPRG